MQYTQFKLLSGSEPLLALCRNKATHMKNPMRAGLWSLVVLLKTSRESCRAFKIVSYVSECVISILITTSNAMLESSSVCKSLPKYN